MAGAIADLIFLSDQNDRSDCSDYMETRLYLVGLTQVDTDDMEDVWMAIWRY